MLCICNAKICTNFAITTTKLDKRRRREKNLTAKNDHPRQIREITESDFPDEDSHNYYQLSMIVFMMNGEEEFEHLSESFYYIHTPRCI